jgi:hypothetical protein
MILAPTMVSCTFQSMMATLLLLVYAIEALLIGQKMKHYLYMEAK